MKLVKGIYFPDSDTHFENVIDDEGNYQKKQFKAALKYIPEENRGLFIDVGAHVGLWSRMAIKARFNQILCFEPDKENYDCLRANLNELKEEMRKCNGGAAAHEIALSDITGNGNIKNEKSDNSGAKHIDLEYKNPFGGQFRVSKFDNIFDSDNIPQEYKNKTLIKIDVQGYEAKVVRGMKKFIQEYKPIIIVEQFLNGQPDYEATMILKSYGMKTLESVEKEVILGW